MSTEAGSYLPAISHEPLDPVKRRGHLTLVYSRDHTEPSSESGKIERELPALDKKEMFILVYTARGRKMREITRMLKEPQPASLKSIYKKYNDPNTREYDNATHVTSLAIKNGVIKREMVDKSMNLADADRLKDAEIDVLRELTNTDVPNSDKAIGERLAISPQLVQRVLQGIYKEYGLDTRAHAAAFYLLSK